MVAGGGASVIYADTVSNICFAYTIATSIPDQNIYILSKCKRYAIPKGMAFTKHWHTKSADKSDIMYTRLEIWVMHWSLETMQSTVVLQTRRRSCSMLELFLMYELIGFLSQTTALEEVA